MFEGPSSPKSKFVAFWDYVLIFVNLSKDFRKNLKLNFGSTELDTVEIIKRVHHCYPYPYIYNPNHETGFGAIPVQKKSDGYFYPVFYFSKITIKASP